MSSGPEKPTRDFWIVFIYVFFYIYFLHGKVVTFICACRDKPCSLTMVFGGVPENMHWFPLQSCLFHALPCSNGFKSCPLCTELSPDSLILFIFCTVDDETFTVQSPCCNFFDEQMNTYFSKSNNIFQHLIVYNLSQHQCFHQVNP